MLTTNRYVETLMKNEAALAGWYQAVGQAIPQCRAFWEQLVVEERAHADILQALKAKLDQGEVRSRNPGFHIDDVCASLDFIEKRMNSLALGEKLTMPEAVDIALILERSMVERDFFALFEGNDEGMRQEFQELRQHTIEHIQRLEKMRQSLVKSS